MPTPYIVDMVRTPVGRFGKSLKDEHPAELAAYAARKLVERTGVDPSIIDFVVMGHVIRAGTSMDT
nr:acetyl-CoA C-acyltransferase [Desulfurococcales archaeon]